MRAKGLSAAALSELKAVLARPLPIQQDRLFLWAVVGFAGGCGLYLQWHFEPHLWSGLMAVGFAVILCRLLWLSVWQIVPFYFILPLALGFAYMQMQAHVLAKRPSPLAGIHQVQGVIKSLDDRGKRLYMDVAVDIVDTQSYDNRGTYMRLSAYASQMPQTPKLRLGDRISLLTKLTVPKAAKAEGSFSPRRYYWFQKIVQRGYALSDVRVQDTHISPLSASHNVPLYTRMRNLIFDMRLAVADSIRAAIGENDRAHVAVALLTGLRGRLNEKVKQDMRYSGLAHLLAISGLHMGFAALNMFFLARLLMCLYPYFALRLPTKPIAATIALGTALMYWLLAGDSVSVHRAWIMVSLFLFAVLLDKCALSLRNVAISALILLLWKPQQIIQPGFQISFMSVIALIAFFEWRRETQSFTALTPQTRNRQIASTITRPFSMAVLSAMIAGFASQPLISHYFGYVASWSLPANVLAVPLTGLWIIPCGFLGLILMPFGAQDLAFTLMAWGIDVLLFIARYTRNLPFGELHLPAFPASALIIFAMGMLWLCLWRTQIRYAGIALIATAYLIWWNTDKPIIIVDANSSMFAVAPAKNDNYLLFNGSPNSYTAKEWQRRYGLNGYDKAPNDNFTTQSIACSVTACRIGGHNSNSPSNHSVALSFSRHDLWRHCLQADVVVTFYDAGNFSLCRTHATKSFSRRQIKQRGAIIIYRDKIRFAETNNGRLWQTQP